MGKYYSQNICILTVTIDKEIKFVLFQISYFVMKTHENTCKSSLFRYCNSRVSVYDEAGRHMHDINGDWTVVHSLALYEQVRSETLSYNINGCCMNEEVLIIFFFLLQNSNKELSNKRTNTILWNKTTDKKIRRTFYASLIERGNRSSVLELDSGHQLNHCYFPSGLL